MNPYRDSDESQFISPSLVSYSDVAVKLLQDNFLLTALELHTELVEIGREVPQLREFFSNPGNFEQHVSRPVDLGSMHRTPSQATLDSLDMTRYSEDGLGDRSGGDVAVLEFELRKARETINALRANLTQAADCDGNTAEKSSGQVMQLNNLKPHERRALNFLINEYLLLQNYKLTSITFSDENPDQDFEDWDDVGLNVARPSDLVSLYRGESSTLPTLKTEISTQTELLGSGSSAVQTNIEDGNTMCVSCQTSFDYDGVDWNHEILVQAEEIVLLKQQILSLETEKINYHKLYDAAIASLNMLSSPASEVASTGTVLYTRQSNVESIPTCNVEQTPGAVRNVTVHNMQPLPHTAANNHYGSGTSTNSISPDQFEIVDSEKNGSNSHRTGSHSSWEEAVRRGSSVTLDELSVHDTGDWTRVQFHEGEPGSSQLWLNSNIPSKLRSALLFISCPVIHPNTGRGGDLLDELEDKSITADTLISLIAETLPRLMPHTLVAARPEATALLAACAALSSPQSRATLLQLLLTMLKKPDAPDIATIAQGARAAAACGAAGEVLSAAAELLAGRGTERRVLAASVVLAAAPHLTVELSTSLLWSSVVTMSECACASVRVRGARAAALACAAAASTPARRPATLAPLQTLMFRLAADTDEEVATQAKRTFAPLLARTALLTDKLHSDYCPAIIDLMKESAIDNNMAGFKTCLDILTASVPALVLYVLSADVVRQRVPADPGDGSEGSCRGSVERGVGGDCSFEDPTSADKHVMGNSNINLAKVKREGHSIDGIAAKLKIEGLDGFDVTEKIVAESLFEDIEMFVEDERVEPRRLLEAMEVLLKNQPVVGWSEKDWLLDTLLRNIFKTLEENTPSLKEDVINTIMKFFDKICSAFGKTFTAVYMKPLFLEQITVFEQKMDRLQSVDVHNVIFATVYLSAILTADSSSENSVQQFFHKWLVCSGTCPRTAAAIAISLSWFSKHQPHLLELCLVCMRQTIAESGERVREQVACVLHELLAPAPLLAPPLAPALASCQLSEVMLTSHIVPALVTLASDDVPGVWEAGIPALGRAARAFSEREGAGACWAALHALVTSSASPRAASLADALERITHDPGADNVQALSCLCKLCLSLAPPLAPFLLGRLVAALQASVHRGGASEQFIRSTLLPAVRKLEQSYTAASPEHKIALDALSHSVAALHAPAPPSSPSRAPPPAPPGADSVGRRVSQLFQQSKPAMNLQNIFKKKS